MRCLVIVMLPVALAGCQDAQKSDVLPPVVVHTPLALDPTDDWKVARWWTNGSQLLRLDAEGSYVLFADQNRYHPPVERGRWSKESYAMVRLDPYDRHRQELVRVGASRVDGRIALTIPGLEPMFALPGPPQVAEDMLLGAWEDGAATLRLSGDRRYSYTPPVSRIDAPAIIAGHHGYWRIEEGEVVLRPDAPNMGPYRLRREDSEDETTLILGEQTFRRRADDAPDDAA